MLSVKCLIQIYVCINHWSEYHILSYTYGIWSTIWNTDIGNLNTQGPEFIKTHSHTHTHTHTHTHRTQRSLRWFAHIMEEVNESEQKTFENCKIL
jgi:hypothetical protein